MEMRFVMVLLLCAASMACSSRPTPAQERAPRPTPIAATSVRPAASSAHETATPNKPADPCPPLQPDEVSDDETPSIAGTSGRVKAGDWLEARGVSKAAFRAWVRSRDPKSYEDFDADTLFDNDDSCQTLTVGDKSEPALVCPLSVRTSIMRYSAVVLVVRNKRVVPVLEVGYALPAMDWPDSRWLDLQLSFSPGGLEADLHDRAKPGSVLVRPPSACRAYFARYLACEKAHRDRTPLNDVCPQSMDPSGATSFGHMSPTPPASPMGGDRVALQGCAEALPKLDQLVKDSGAGGPFGAEFKADRAFAIKSCKALGRYVWKGERFLRAPP